MRAGTRARLERIAAGIEELARRNDDSAGVGRFSAYYGREFQFCVDHFLGADGKPKRYWSAQRAIMERLMEHRRVTIRSCRKGSKTETFGDLIVAFTQTGPGIVVSTAAGGRQVETGLWSRVRSQFGRTRVPLIGECLTTKLTVAPDQWAIGFSTNDSGRFLGFHAGVDVPDDPDAAETAKPDDVIEAIDRAAYEVGKRSSAKRLLLLFDEAPHVDQVIYEASKGSMLGDKTYVVLGGNPHIEYEEPHEFALSHHPGSGYHRIKITAPEDPDEEPDPIDADETFVVPWWLGRKDDYERLYPKGTPLFNPDARGRFAQGDTSGRVISYTILRGAAEPTDALLKRGAHVGFDTAAEGGDANVASLYVDSTKVSEDMWHSADTIDTWERMKRLRTHWETSLDIQIPWRNVHIDDAPIAKGIIDVARREGCHLDAVSFASSPLYSYRSITGEVEYVNRRAEMYWSLRELLRTGRACIPAKYAESWRELAATSYSFDSKGRLLMEPKAAIKARLGRSPDHADSDVLAFCASPKVTVRRV